LIQRNGSRDARAHIRSRREVRRLYDESSEMKPIRSILVHVDAGVHVRPRLQLAAALGKSLGADVTALYAVTPVFVELAFATAMGALPQGLLEVDESRLAKARTLVSAVSAESGVPIEWRAAREAPEAATITHALCADLLVLGQRDRADHQTGVLPDFAPWVLTGSGKPAVLVPFIGARASAFSNVMVAWKATREAAHALSAAIPLLRSAHSINVVLDGDTTPTDRELLRAFLRRHGLQALEHTLASSPSTAGEAILSMAADLGADLIVMGCYGHSRTREFVLGGASRTVLESMTVPVLMAH
jgi:nucleotide-binding universal stress UspA family protein